MYYQKNIFILFFFAFSSMAFGQTSGYEVFVKKITPKAGLTEKLPALHSFSMAYFYDENALHSAESKTGEVNLLLVGGRTNGLHQVNYKFTDLYSNDSLYAIKFKVEKDTLSTLTVESLNKNNLPKAVTSKVDTTHFRANNAQYIQGNGYLHILGGIEFLECGEFTAAGKFNTDHSFAYSYSRFSALNYVNVFNHIMNKTGASIQSTDIYQVKNQYGLDVSGGNLGYVGKKAIDEHNIIMTFGWEMPYNDYNYTRAIMKFTASVGKITKTVKGKSTTGIDLNVIRHNDLCNAATPVYNYGGNGKDKGTMRRRDGNLVPMIRKDKNGDLNFENLYMGGVFLKGTTVHQEPIYIRSDETVDTSVHFKQLSNNYTCPVLPIYDTTSNTMYATLFGGMTYNPKNTSTAFGTSIPFTNRIQTFSIIYGTDGDLIIDSLYSGSSVPSLPIANGFLGANSVFIPAPKLDVAKNGVIQLDVAGLNKDGKLIGYIFGGIKADYRNVLNVSGRSSENDSHANNVLYAVYIKPL